MYTIHLHIQIYNISQSTYKQLFCIILQLKMLLPGLSLISESETAFVLNKLYLQDVNCQQFVQVTANGKANIFHFQQHEKVLSLES